MVGLASAVGCFGDSMGIKVGVASRVDEGAGDELKESLGEIVDVGTRVGDDEGVKLALGG